MQRHGTDPNIVSAVAEKLLQLRHGVPAKHTTTGVKAAPIGAMRYLNRSVRAAGVGQGIPNPTGTLILPNRSRL
jgi:hypothetical protein